MSSPPGVSAVGLCSTALGLAILGWTLNSRGTVEFLPQSLEWPRTIAPPINNCEILQNVSPAQNTERKSLRNKGWMRALYLSFSSLAVLKDTVTSPCHTEK